MGLNLKCGEKIKMIRKLIVVLLFFVFSLPIYSDEIDEDNETLFYMFSLNNRFELKRNFLNSEKPEKLSFSDNSTGYYFYAMGTLLWFPTDTLNLNLSVNSGLIRIKNLYYENGVSNTTINDESASDYARKSLFIDELFIEYDDLFKLGIGKSNTTVGTDFVFNDYVFFLRTDFYLYKQAKRRLTLGLQYNTIDGSFTTDYKSSPMISADITYKNGKLFNLSFFSLFLYDNDNAFGKIYEPFVEAFVVKKMIEAGVNASVACGGDISQCIKADSKGYLIWGGLDLKGKYNSFSYRTNLILNYGDMEITPYIYVNGTTIDIYKRRQSNKLTQYLKYGDSGGTDGGTNGGTSTNQGSLLNKELSNRKLLGYMIFAEIGYKFFKLLEISPYFLLMSGESNLEKSGYLNSFISVKSYITLSNIFFNGGLNETASSRSFSLSGVNGQGLINPGIWFRIKKEDSPFRLNLGGMKFFSYSSNTNKKNDYGTEIDFTTGYTITEFLELSFEADYFISGDFFKNESVSINNPFKILFGLNLFLDNLD